MCDVLVDQVTGGSGLAGIDMADNDDVDVKLLLTIDPSVILTQDRCSEIAWRRARHGGAGARLLI